MNKRHRTYHFFFLCLFLTGLFSSALPVSAHTKVTNKPVHELRQKRFSLLDCLHPVDTNVKPVGNSRNPFSPGDEPLGGGLRIVPAAAVLVIHIPLYHNRSEGYEAWQQQYLQHIYPFHHFW